MKKDLVVLAADKDMEHALKGLFTRPEALDIRPIRSSRLDQRHRVRRDPFAPAREAHPFRRRRLDVHRVGPDAEIGGEAGAHPVQMRGEPRRLGDDRGVRVHHFESPAMEKGHDAAEQDPAVDPGKLRVRVRKVPADVPEPRRTEQGIAQGVDEDVAVGVGGKAPIELDGDPAEHQLRAGREPMGIVSVADAVHGADVSVPDG